MTEFSLDWERAINYVLKTNNDYFYDGLIIKRSKSKKYILLLYNYKYKYMLPNEAVKYLNINFEIRD